MNVEHQVREILDKHNVMFSEAVINDLVDLIMFQICIERQTPKIREKGHSITIDEYGTTGEKWYIDNSFNFRTVAYREITEKDYLYHGVDLKVCGDCGRPTKYIIHELMPTNPFQPLVWGWCGCCCVGG